MKLPQSFTTVTPLSKLLAAVLFILLPILSFFIGMNYQGKLTINIYFSPEKESSISSSQYNNVSSPTIAQDSTASYIIKSKCQLYGKIEDKNRFLDKYTVKSGDTLLSIAKTQLGSTSRIGDIILLNKNRYADLSTENSFLEEGWVLYLPPDYIKSVNTLSNGYPKLIFAWGGELTDITKEGKWVVRGPNRNFAYDFKPNENTKYFGKSKNEFTVGDCIMAVIEEIDLNIYGVFLQK